MYINNGSRPLPPIEWGSEYPTCAKAERIVLIPPDMWVVGIGLSIRRGLEVFTGSGVGIVPGFSHDAVVESVTADIERRYPADRGWSVDVFAVRVSGGSVPKIPVKVSVDEEALQYTREAE